MSQNVQCGWEMEVGEQVKVAGGEEGRLVWLGQVLVLCCAVLC